MGIRKAEIVISEINKQIENICIQECYYYSFKYQAYDSKKRINDTVSLM